MKTNIFLTSSLRKPFRSLLLLVLFGLISFVFITKAVGFILVQRETEVLGSYYRSIGVLENTKDPQSGDVSAGVDLIKNSPYFAYGNPAYVASGVMAQTFNTSFYTSNATVLIKSLPSEYWPNVHNTDIWFTGKLLAKEEIGVDGNKAATGKAIGYSLKFDIDTLLAAYPENASQGSSIVLLFLFDGNESAIPTIRGMAVGQRYLIRAWDDFGSLSVGLSKLGARFQILPLDDQQLWYKMVAKDESLDFSTPDMADIKNRTDILNENLHSLGIIATVDLSAMPRMQEASHFYSLTAGRWLNHQDDLAASKLIVIPEDLANQRGLKLDDELQLTFRPLRDTYYGQIRDGIDTILWHSYPTYQDTFKIVGIYTSRYGAVWSYIPSGTLRLGFASTTQKQFQDEAGYSFILDSSRNQSFFIQEYQDALQSMGISLTFLDNNGAAYWAAVDPIRRSSSADALIFGLLMVTGLILTVFLYIIQHKREYAIARALGVPRKRANNQVVLPLLLFGGFGILLGGMVSWKDALGKAKTNLSTIPTPAGVAPSADINPLFLVILCLVIFFLLAVFSWLGVQFLARRSVFDLLQGQTHRLAGEQKQADASKVCPVNPSSSSGHAGAVDNTPKAIAATRAAPALIGKYTPASLSRYALRQVVRSGFKSILTLAIALGFMFSSGWLSQTMQRNKAEIDHLYDTTVVEADILPGDPSAAPPLTTVPHGNGFVYLNTVNSILDSGYVISSNLEAETLWSKIQDTGSQTGLTGSVSVYAYDSPEAFTSGLADPGSLVFASGWDSNLFARHWTLEDIQKEGIPMLIPSSMLEQSQLEIGAKVKVTEMSGSISPGVIVGQYSGGRAVTINHVKTKVIGSESILIPLSVLEAMERSKTTFTVAHFVLDPAKNRDLSQVSSDMEKVIKTPSAGTRDLRFMIWDEQLRIVIVQLEKNLSILKVLYPVVMAVSVLIAAGLCFLLLLQKTREAAILRVLGTTRTAVRMVLIVESFCLSLIGVVIGLGLTALLWTSAGSMPAGGFLTSAGLYLAGALAGLVSGAILVTNRQPIELLQVKE